jgi:hypothetical protein
VLSITNSPISWIRHYSIVASFVGFGVTDMERKTWKQFLYPAFLKIKLHRNLGTHSLCLDLANCTISLQRNHSLSGGSISRHTYLKRIECTQPLKLCECNKARKLSYMYGERRHGKCLSVISLNINSLWDVVRELAEPITSHWLNLTTSSWLWTTHGSIVAKLVPKSME